VFKWAEDDDDDDDDDEETGAIYEIPKTKYIKVSGELRAA